MACNKCGNNNTTRSPYMEISDIPEGEVTVFLTVNQDLPKVPSKIYKSNISNIKYRLRSKEDVLEVLVGDLDKLLGLQYMGMSIYEVSEYTKEDFKSQSVEEQEAKLVEEAQDEKNLSEEREEKIEPLPELPDTGLFEKEVYDAQQEIKNQTMVDDIKKDDFKQISGIGDATQEKLHSYGIYTFEDLFGANIDAIEEIGIRQSWIDQAKELMGE